MGELNFSGVTMLSVLLCGNLWFVRRLILKIEHLDTTVTSRLPVQQNEIKNMANKVEGLEGEIKSLAMEIKNFGSLRERIAVIESLVKKSRVKKES